MKTRLSLLSAAALFFALASPGALPAQSDHASKLIEGAKKEARLVWYTSMAIDTSKPILDAFLQQYPFIKADLVRAGEEQLLNRAMTETRAGRWLFDVISSSGIQVLSEKDFLAPYHSPEMEAYIKEFKDSQGRWTAVYINNLVVVYNTKMVGAREIPKDYGDLLDPRWKGKIIVDSTDYDWFGALVAAWGRDKAVPYMEQLARQQPAWRRGHGLVAQLVGAGEAPLGWAYSFRAERMKSEGAPVDWVETFNPVVTTINGVGLSARAGHPNAAKLFIDFILSRRAQEMIQGMRRIPSRKDVKPAVPKMDQSKLKLRLVPTEVFINLDQYAREFRQIFGL